MRKERKSRDGLLFLSYICGGVLSPSAECLEVGRGRDLFLLLSLLFLRFKDFLCSVDTAS